MRAIGFDACVQRAIGFGVCVQSVSVRAMCNVFLFQCVRVIGFSFGACVCGSKRF